jgi:hypothetical protein
MSGIKALCSCYDMEVIFNEYSLEYTPPNSKVAENWLFSLFESLFEISKRRNVKVSMRSAISFEQLLVREDYPFMLWLYTLENIEFRRMVASALSKKPLIICREYDFSFFGKNVIGLGVAYLNDYIVVSYPEKKWGSVVSFSNDYFDDFGILKTKKCSVGNVSNKKHIDLHFPSRIFEHHKKHDIRRGNINDGESTLFYSIPKDYDKVQLLLNGARRIKGASSAKLYNMDKSNGKYIEFQLHSNGRYHGYHIDDENRVPDKLKKIISATEYLNY